MIDTALIERIVEADDDYPQTPNTPHTGSKNALKVDFSRRAKVDDLRLLVKLGRRMDDPWMLPEYLHDC